MILDKEVIVSIFSKNLTYYRKKGYNVKYGEIITVKVEDLYEKTTVKINVKCDNCDYERNIQYRLYNNNLNKYGLYYCNKCKHLKSKKTKLEIYGDENYNNYEKNKKTCLEKYGVEHFNMSKEFTDKIKNTKLIKHGDVNYNNIKKCQETKLHRYGDKNYNNQDKNKETCLNRYGKSNIFNVPVFKEKNFESRKKRLINLYKDYNLIDIDYENYNYICQCEKNHIFEIPKTIFYNRMKTNINLCTICNPIGFTYSESENELFNFIEKNYKGEIIHNSRNIIPPYELDIFIPELKLAFEYNGLYWHSDKYKPKNYHLDKTNLCEEKNIHLIHVYEDDWLDKQDIVKSRILNLIGKSEKIMARKCEIRELMDTKSVRDFLVENHLQGFVGSTIKLGLFYNNELVSLMTFGNLRKAMGGKSKDGTYEMLRFCNKINMNVIGGASRLFNYFIKKFSPQNVISYADRSWSLGNLYEKLNFSFVHKTSPNYFYIVDNKRFHRFMFRKDKLIKEGYDKNKTEFEIMNERGINRIYDSGHLKYEYNN
jgi:hypothetical protein